MWIDSEWVYPHFLYSFGTVWNGNFKVWNELGCVVPKIEAKMFQRWHNLFQTFWNGDPDFVPKAVLAYPSPFAVFLVAGVFSV